MKVVGEFYRESAAKRTSAEPEGDSWVCGHCAFSNYAVRMLCFKCKLKRGEEPRIEDSLYLR